MQGNMRKYWIDTEENKGFLKEIREGLLAFGHRFPSPQGSSCYLGDDGRPGGGRQHIRFMEYLDEQHFFYVTVSHCEDTCAILPNITFLFW